MEVAGRVTKLGPGVDALKVGDKVAAHIKHGGYADRVVAPVSQVALIPESIPSSVAAAFPVSYASAELALDRAALVAGEVVVIGGAGGAVGTACIELAKRRGATVIACVGDQAKEDIARACGADEIVSSRSKNLLEEIKGVAPDGVDVVIDPVGGNFFEDSLRALRYDGRMIVLGFASGKIPSLRTNHVLVNHQSIIGSSFGLTCARDPERISSIWPLLVDLLEQGHIKPRVSRTMPFSELPRALELIRDRKVAGRIVLS
jgi:NADPH2:quinone reductase